MPGKYKDGKYYSEFNGVEIDSKVTKIVATENPMTMANPKDYVIYIWKDPNDPLGQYKLYTVDTNIIPRRMIEIKSSTMSYEEIEEIVRQKKLQGKNVYIKDEHDDKLFPYSKLENEGGTINGSVTITPVGETDPNVGLLSVNDGSDDIFKVYKDGHATVKTMGDESESVPTKAYVDDIIKVVPSMPTEFSDQDVKKIFRKKSPDQRTVTSVQVIDKEFRSGGDKISYVVNTTKNNIQVYERNLLTYFDTNITDVIGADVNIDRCDYIYTVYLTTSPIVKALRISTGNDRGNIVLRSSVLAGKTVKIIAGQYFSYNPTTGEKKYDTNAEIAITTTGLHEYILTAEPQTYEVEVGSDGYLSITTNVQRAYLYGIGAASQEENIYTPKELAKQEFVEEKIEEVQDYIEQEVEPRISTAESDISQNTKNINNVNVDLQETKEKIGDVSIYDAEYLPRARSEFMKKILRVDGKLYQCIRHGEEKTYSFENVQGTSEVTANKWDTFANEVTSEFGSDFNLRDIPEWIPAPSMRADGTEYRTTDGIRDVNVEIAPDTGSYTIISYEGTFSPDTGEEVVFPISEIDYIYSNLDNNNFQIDNIGDNISFDIAGDNRRIYFTCQDNTGFTEDSLQYLEGKVNNLQISKFYRNNGSIKLGSSSAYGMFELEVASDKEPITKIVLNVKSYNANKSSGFAGTIYDEHESEYEFSGYVEPSDYAQEFTIYNGENMNVKYIKIESDPSIEGAQENRLLILSMTVTYGDPYYEWKEVSGSGGTKLYRHHIVCNLGEIDIIASHNTPIYYNTNNDENLSQNLKYIQVNPTSVDMIKFLNTINAGMSFIYYDLASRVFNMTLLDEIDFLIESDTITDY